jgi:hypothetical protein
MEGKVTRDKGRGRGRQQKWRGRRLLEPTYNLKQSTGVTRANSNWQGVGPRHVMCFFYFPSFLFAVPGVCADYGWRPHVSLWILWRSGTGVAKGGRGGGGRGWGVGICADWLQIGGFMVFSLVWTSRLLHTWSSRQVRGSPSPAKFSKVLSDLL